MTIKTDSQLVIESINVGHGDCTLLIWDNGRSSEPWRCLVDAGDGNDAHMKAIMEVLKKHNIATIDLVVLSHFDTDHIGGLIKLSQRDDVQIVTYWSPYTPAFAKYDWLFGERGRQAIHRANQLEDNLRNKKVNMYAPLDGYKYDDGDLKISVYSPPRKLYERLLSGHDIEELFEVYPTPIGNILFDEMDYSGEGLANVAVHGFNHRRQGNLVERNLDLELSELDSLPEFRGNLDSQSICTAHKIEPEFFGNALLNDTSLVIKMEFWVGTRWFNLLFPGDLENWVYVLSKHQTDIYSDFYKVSHHGGRVYVNRKEAQDSVIQAIRPTLSVISANGEYKLPRRETREALTRWSSSVQCQLQRGCDRFSLDGTLPRNQQSCKSVFKCQPRAGNLTFEIRNGELSTNVQSCQRVYTPNTLPVIQFEQHFVPDSRVLLDLTEREIERHSNFVKEQLKSIHDERVAEGPLHRSDLVPLEEIQMRFRTKGIVMSSEQIRQVCHYGHMNEKFWSLEEFGRWNAMYKLPTKSEMVSIRREIFGYELMVGYTERITSGLSSILYQVDRNAFGEFLEGNTRYPRELIQRYVWPTLVPEIMKHYRAILAREYKCLYVILVRRDCYPPSKKFEQVMKEIRLKEALGKRESLREFIENSKTGNTFILFLSEKTGHDFTLRGVLEKLQDLTHTQDLTIYD